MIELAPNAHTALRTAAIQASAQVKNRNTFIAAITQRKQHDCAIYVEKSWLAVR
jgi:hypothetical protein